MSLDQEFDQVLDRIGAAEDMIQDTGEPMEQVEETVADALTAIEEMEARLEPD